MPNNFNKLILYVIGLPLDEKTSNAAAFFYKVILAGMAKILAKYFKVKRRLRCLSVDHEKQLCHFSVLNGGNYEIGDL